MKLIGILTSSGYLSGTLELGKINAVTGTLKHSESMTGTIMHSDETPYYKGDYEITPTAYDQSLDTKGFKMASDVIINEIPYYETTNESGGYTVIIGG